MTYKCMGYPTMTYQCTFATSLFGRLRGVTITAASAGYMRGEKSDGSFRVCSELEDSFI